MIALYYKVIEEMEGELRFGFFDKASNTFYEVGSKAEYEQCLEYYQKMLEQEEAARMEVLAYLEEFDDTFRTVSYRQEEPAFSELREYEF